jgi:hypothetical protein
MLLDAIFPDNNSSLLQAKDFPLFTAFKSAFSGLLHEQIPRQSYETRRFALASAISGHNKQTSNGPSDPAGNSA